MNTTLWFSFLAGVALKGAAVLAVAWIASILLRRRSAAARHLLWTAAFAAVLFLPAFSVSLPALPAPSFATLPPGVAAMFQVTATDNATTPGGTLGAAAPASFKPAWRPDWRLAIVLVWSSGVVASLLELLVSCIALWRLRRSARPSADQQLAGQLAAELGISRRVCVLETSEGTMPMTCGILAPAILMPRDARHWTEERRRIVLLHELAHVRRADVATHFLARLALTLHWFNPLAWVAWRGFLKERERAADDLVLSSGARASDYAGHLLDIARNLEAARVLAPAALAMARRSELEGRLVAILDSRLKRGVVSRATALASVFAALVLIAPFAALRAQEKQSAGQEVKYRALAQVSRPPSVNTHTSESATALIQRGVTALLKKRVPQAIDDFQRAESLDSKQAGHAQMWLAVANERESNPADADALYKSALGLADPNSDDAATVMELYARFLTRQGRDDEAKPMSARAAELRKSTPADSGDAIRMGPGVAPPRLTKKVEPQYTDEARAAKYEGTAVLFVDIGADGIPRNIQVIRGLGLGLNDAAITAVSQWHFDPGKKDGEPVTVQATIEVNFRLL